MKYFGATFDVTTQAASLMTDMYNLLDRNPAAMLDIVCDMIAMDRILSRQLGMENVFGVNMTSDGKCLMISGWLLEGVLVSASGISKEQSLTLFGSDSDFFYKMTDEMVASYSQGLLEV